MMLYPPLATLVDKVGSRYQLVNLVARRAREIATDAEENEIPMDEKPVSEAINEVYNGEVVLTSCAEPFSDSVSAIEPVVEAVELAEEIAEIEE